MSKILKILVLAFLLTLTFSICTYAKEFQQQINIETDKSWHIKFNIAVDIKTLDGNVSITDSKGKIINTLMNVSDDKKIVTLIPKKAYVSNEIYSLNVNQNIKSVKGKVLNENSIKKFSVTEYKINKDNEKIMKEFRSHHGYSSDELEKLKIKYIGNVDNFYIYYVPFKDNSYDYDKDFEAKGYRFPAKSHTRIIGIKDGKLYTLGNIIYETSISVKDLYNLLLDEYKDLTKIGQEN
jgi:hypothetical protein